MLFSATKTANILIIHSTLDFIPKTFRGFENNTVLIYLFGLFLYSQYFVSSYFNTTHVYFMYQTKTKRKPVFISLILQRNAYVHLVLSRMLNSSCYLFLDIILWSLHEVNKVEIPVKHYFSFRNVNISTIKASKIAKFVSFSATLVK